MLIITKVYITRAKRRWGRWQEYLRRGRLRHLHHPLHLTLGHRPLGAVAAPAACAMRRVLQDALPHARHRWRRRDADDGGAAAVRALGGRERVDRSASSVAAAARRRELRL